MQTFNNNTRIKNNVKKDIYSALFCKSLPCTLLMRIFSLFVCHKHPALELQWLLSSFRWECKTKQWWYSVPEPPFLPLSSSKTHQFSWYLPVTLLPTPFQWYPSHSLWDDDVGYECATALEGEEHLVRAMGKRSSPFIHTPLPLQTFTLQMDSLKTHAHTLIV